MRSPSGRCGFTYAGARGTEHCCYRETWRETGRCVWHADTGDDEGKPNEALIAVREDTAARRQTGDHGPTELLDGAELTGETLPEGIDLTGVSLRDADLSDADLYGATLRGADLRDADLADADLERGDLTRANCRDANLHEADLLDATLREATLRATDLTDAVLRGATLADADLEGAFLNRADLFDADLADTRLYGAFLATARINDGTTLDERCVYDPARTETEPEPGGEGPDLHTKATSTYQELEKLCAENALLSAQSRYFVRRQDIHTAAHREEGRWGRWLRARVSRAVLLYGESPFRVLGTAAGIILLSTVLYPLGYLRNSATGELLTYSTPARPVALAHTLLDSLYFSTLSFTTMTYGHFVPVGGGKFLTMIETGSGVVLIALLVFVFGRRATR
ncbi:MAG: pentapeptide repeat-containing protein [Haloferacaceae archaeon]